MIQHWSILFGWVLGIVSSLIFRRLDRRRKVGDFKKGLGEELKYLLPRLVSDRCLIKNAFGEMDQETLKWALASYSSGYKDYLDKQSIEAMEKLLTKSKPEEISIVSKIMAESKGIRGWSHKKYHLPFLKTNINAIPLLAIGLQTPIFKVHQFLDFINQEIDLYYFYFQKTFDPSSMGANKEGLIENQSKSCKVISDLSFRTANEVLDLIKKLDC